MWKNFLVIGLVLSLCSCASSPRVEHLPCDPVNLSGFYAPFNQMICAAQRKMEEGAYQEAVNLLTRASTMSIHETPNFKLFDPLALALYRSGEVEAARRMLKKAELSLMVYSRIVRCSEYDMGAFLVGRRVSDFDQDLRDEVAMTFCSAMYGWLANGATLFAIPDEYARYQQFMRIKAEIEGEQALP